MNDSGFYNAAVYCRLSKDDAQLGDSTSIKTQETMLSNYVSQNGWRVADVYTDDGISGTTFERKGFNRMLSDIEAGKVNMVVTKDLSRLGRDYLKTGYFTEIYFPENDVRYIALNDGMSKKYQKEQAELKRQVKELETALNRMKEYKGSSRKWMELIAKYSDLKELDAEIVNELIEQIVSHNGLKDVDFLGGVSNLDDLFLNLQGNQIRDISPLSRLQEIYVLDLGNNIVEDLSSLSNLKKATHISVANNPIKDISALRNLKIVKRKGVTSPDPGINIYGLKISNKEIKEIFGENAKYIYKKGI